jgi:hypothetical protein
MKKSELIEILNNYSEDFEIVIPDWSYKYAKLEEGNIQIQLLAIEGNYVWTQDDYDLSGYEETKYLAKNYIVFE